VIKGVSREAAPTRQGSDVPIFPSEISPTTSVDPGAQPMFAPDLESKLDK
jgi:hypothetical protein